MKTFSLACLVVALFLLTGCPHNEYIVELTPSGSAVERNFIFYRADGVDSNGVPNYQSFSTNELIAITAVYPAGAVSHDGERHAAKGQFSNTMPGDVGGAGWLKTFSTSLGTAGFYSERFRGNDDLAAMTKTRIAAADQLSDIILGWSRKQFGHEPGYKNLRRFLDTEFRRDLRNLAMYSWSGAVASSYKSEAAEEFVVRFAHYLVERGYVKLSDAADLTPIVQGKDEAMLRFLIRRLIAEKLGVAESAPPPKSLAIFADPEALEKSFDDFAAGTDLYHSKLRQWQKEKKLQPGLKKPEPLEVIGNLVEKLLGLNFHFLGSQPNDRLTVKLALPFAPNHSNGKWDEATRRVVWESDLEEKGHAERLPVYCYASWSTADEAFQQEHFGRAILSGDELFNYCVWRSGLSAAQAREWDKLLLQLRPDEQLARTLDSFKFLGGGTEQIKDAAFGLELIKTALERFN